MTDDTANLPAPEQARALLQRSRPYLEMMMQYECAMREVATKFEVLRAEYAVRYNRNPIESIRTRLKSPGSIAAKLQRRAQPLTVASARENLHDIAGVRVICSFPKDIYTLSDMFLRQDDITLVRKKDYIATPKANGYRSLHLIVEVPIFLTQGSLRVPVEVQFRTIAMDFWSSLEHKTQYKKDLPNGCARTKELAACAEQIAALDLRMQAIHESLEADETGTPHLLQE